MAAMRDEGRVRSRILKASVFVVSLSMCASSALGCGGVIYSARANSVAAKVESAKEMGAETLAPYQYYSAREHAEKAAEEASRADYGDALDLLDEAEAFADKAIEQAGAVKKGAGR
jgi:hypothetical protein